MAESRKIYTRARCSYDKRKINHYIEAYLLLLEIFDEHYDYVGISGYTARECMSMALSKVTRGKYA